VIESCERVNLATASGVAKTRFIDDLSLFQRESWLLKHIIPAFQIVVFYMLAYIEINNKKNLFAKDKGFFFCFK
jgi:hypothetical protein